MENQNKDEFFYTCFRVFCQLFYIQFAYKKNTACEFVSARARENRLPWLFCT